MLLFWGDGIMLFSQKRVFLNNNLTELTAFQSSDLRSNVQKCTICVVCLYELQMVGSECSESCQQCV